MKNKITLYSDLVDVEIKDFGEEFVALNDIFQTDIWSDFWTQVDWKIIIRKTVKRMIDVAIYDKLEKKFLDFGTELLDFSTEKCFTFSDEISDEAKKNRMLLRDIMMEVWFAPYDGEWWHFSYWDVEWACFYWEDNAIYGQKRLNEIVL